MLTCTGRFPKTLYFRYWATKGNKVAMASDECMLSSAASMAVGFTEDTTPEVRVALVFSVRFDDLRKSCKHCVWASQ